MTKGFLGYDTWKTASPHDDEPDDVDLSEFTDDELAKELKARGWYVAVRADS